MSTPDTSQTSDTVRVVAPIPLNVLSRLLTEYSDRLVDKTSDLQRERNSPHRDEIIIGDLLEDVRYLANQTEKLISKASAYREHITLDEGERFELELRLFDAEDALRPAKRVLQTPDPGAPSFIRGRNKT